MRSEMKICRSCSERERERERSGADVNEILRSDAREVEGVSAMNKDCENCTYRKQQRSRSRARRHGGGGRSRGVILLWKFVIEEGIGVLVLYCNKGRGGSTSFLKETMLWSCWI